jgi:hypothetical protein
VIEPSVEEIVAEYEARRQTMRTDDLVALIADWRKRGEALGQFADPHSWGITPWGFRWGGEADDPCRFALAALKGNGEG